MAMDKLVRRHEVEKSFQMIAFTMAQILTCVDFCKSFNMETDAFNFALGAILSQMGGKKDFIQLPFIPISCCYKNQL